jgi:membrane glycosyltransferase
LGLVWGVVIVYCAPLFIWWIMPVLAGLLFSVLLAVWTSGPRLGRWMRAWGLLLTPEESNVPAELAAVHRCAPFVIDAAASEPAHRVPEPAPLRMEATMPVYLRFGAVVGAVAPQLTPPDPLSRVEVRY